MAATLTPRSPERTRSVHEWESETLPPGFSMLVFGARRSGKSTALFHLYREIRGRFDHVVVFTTAANQGHYRAAFDTPLVFDRFEPDRLAELVASQQAAAAAGTPPPTLVLFDDCIAAGNQQKSDESMLELFSRGRHIGVSVIFATQSATRAGHVWRQNSDVVLILQQHSRQDRDTAVREYLEGEWKDEAGDPLSAKEVDTALRAATQDHRIVVVDFVAPDGEDSIKTWLPELAPEALHFQGRRFAKDEAVEAWLDERGWGGFVRHRRDPDRHPGVHRVTGFSAAVNGGYVPLSIAFAQAPGESPMPAEPPSDRRAIEPGVTALEWPRRK